MMQAVMRRCGVAAHRGVAARAFSNSAWGANDALLVSVKGTDRPGITANLSQVFHEVGAEFIDADQAVVHQQLSLNFLLGMPDVGGGTSSSRF